MRAGQLAIQAVPPIATSFALRARLRPRFNRLEEHECDSANDANDARCDDQLC